MIPNGFLVFCAVWKACLGGQVCAHAGCASVDSVLLQATASRQRTAWRKLATAEELQATTSWVAGPFGNCVLQCGVAKRYRKVRCRSFFEDVSAPRRACAALQEPSHFKACDCGLTPCTIAACDVDDRSQKHDAPISPEVGHEFAHLGCLLHYDEVKSPQQSVYDLACLNWTTTSPCRGGLPFYRMESNAMSPSSCYLFCVSKGLDIFGIVQGSTCRCGASHLNRAVWHNGAPREGLLIPSERLVQLLDENAEKTCGTRVYRYAGHYEMGGVPFSHTRAAAQDVAYIDSIVAGHVISDIVEEDGAREGGNAGKLKRSGRLIKHPTLKQKESLDMDTHHQEPGWARPCWPYNCGPGGGPWTLRQSAVAAGLENQWQDYAIISYFFDAATIQDDDRREAFREAAGAWNAATCVRLVEHQSQPDGAHLRVAVDDPENCYAMGIGFPGNNSHSTINMGWCNSPRYIGNLIHEIGHILGMNHEQRRPDAIREYHGKGPFLVMHWENVPEFWREQYMADPQSYMGSQGEYAAYDFESIMHYSPSNRFDTLPPDAKALTGQRHHLSDKDTAQINDFYDCRIQLEHDASPMTS